MTRKQLIIVPGYFKSGSTLMYRHVWPKLGFSLLPKRSVKNNRNILFYILKVLNKIGVYKNFTPNIKSGRRVDFELCHTTNSTDEITDALKSIFEITKSEKVVAEIGFLRPGVSDDNLKSLREPIRKLRAEGVDIKIFISIREQSEIILSRLKHDYRTFPPWKNEDNNFPVTDEYLKSIFSNEITCRCVYPFCLSDKVDGMGMDCIGDCGKVGKKIYHWSLFDFSYQVERFKTLTGVGDIYVQPLSLLLDDTPLAISKIANWIGIEVDLTLFETPLPVINKAPNIQSEMILNNNAKELISKKYRKSNQELCELYKLPICCLTAKPSIRS